MPLLDLQARLVEVGRIRMGARREAKRRSGTGTVLIPTKLDTWRLTSRDRRRIDAVAELYGGEPQEWAEHPGEWEIITKSAELDIAVLPGTALSQAWEMWGQAVEKGPLECLRRCDGHRQQPSGAACVCPLEYDERRELAAEGQACKPTTRLNVILPRVPGIGAWRLDTRGFNAATELMGTAQLLMAATARGALLRARLRLEQRSDVVKSKTVTFRVPVIDVDETFLRVLEVGRGAAFGELVDGGGLLELPAAGEAQPYTPIQRPSGGTVAEAVAAANDPPDRQRTGRRPQAPMGPVTPPPAEADPITPEPPPPPSSSSSGPPYDPPGMKSEITFPQYEQVVALARTVGLDDETMRDTIEVVTGQRHVKGVKAGDLDAVLTALAEKGGST